MVDPVQRQQQPCNNGLDPVHLAYRIVRWQLRGFIRRGLQLLYVGGDLGWGPGWTCRGLVISGGAHKRLHLRERISQNVNVRFNHHCLVENSELDVPNANSASSSRSQMLPLRKRPLIKSGIGNGAQRASCVWVVRASTNGDQRPGAAAATGGDSAAAGLPLVRSSIECPGTYHCRSNCVCMYVAKTLVQLRANIAPVAAMSHRHSCTRGTSSGASVAAVRPCADSRCWRQIT